MVHPGGRPRTFKSPEDLEKKIDEYFNSGCKRIKRIKDKNGKYKQVEEYLPTITGLALYLGFVDRRSFYDYEERGDEFSYIIKKARTFIEREYEEMLKTNPTGAIFALKNFGWKDKQEIENKHTGELSISGIKIEVVE